MVVDVPEQVERGFELVEVVGGRLPGKPSFEGLMEPCDLALGRGVMRSGPGRRDPEMGEGGGDDLAEGLGVVGLEPCGPAQDAGNCSEDGGAGAGLHGRRVHEHAAVVVDDVEDLYLGAVGESLGACRRAASFVWRVRR